MTVTIERAVTSALKSVRTQIDGVEALAEALRGAELSHAFDAAVTAIGNAKGRLIVTGMGKSGLIGRKIAATLASTGTPSLYIHPAEASHGDLGMIGSDDMVLALSWSGETTELSDIITYCGRFDVMLLVITSRCNSTAGRAADICLALPRVAEACPHQLAPTTSTTLQVVLGDALAVALVERRGFSATEFRVFHPGGKLGAQLLTVGDVMGRGDALPVIGLDATLTDATIEMSRKRYGSTAVVDNDERLVGIFTDGDLRRSITTGSLDDKIVRHMTTHPLTVGPQMLASEALRVMNENAVSLLFVCDDDRLIGAVHVHDVFARRRRLREGRRDRSHRHPRALRLEAASRQAADPERLMRDFGAPVLVSYAQSEHPIITSSTLDDTPEMLAETVGKVVPHVTAKVIDRASGRTLGPGRDRRDLRALCNRHARLLQRA